MIESPKRRWLQAASVCVTSACALASVLLVISAPPQRAIFALMLIAFLTAGVMEQLYSSIGLIGDSAFAGW
jgi:hypothetical protein